MPTPASRGSAESENTSKTRGHKMRSLCRRAGGGKRAGGRGAGWVGRRRAPAAGSTAAAGLSSHEPGGPARGVAGARRGGGGGRRQRATAGEGRVARSSPAAGSRSRRSRGPLRGGGAAPSAPLSPARLLPAGGSPPGPAASPAGVPNGGVRRAAGRGRGGEGRKPRAAGQQRRGARWTTGEGTDDPRAGPTPRHTPRGRRWGNPPAPRSATPAGACEAAAGRPGAREGRERPGRERSNSNSGPTASNNENAQGPRGPTGGAARGADGPPRGNSPETKGSATTREQDRLTAAPRTAKDNGQGGGRETQGRRTPGGSAVRQRGNRRCRHVKSGARQESAEQGGGDWETHQGGGGGPATERQRGPAPGRSPADQRTGPMRRGRGDSRIGQRRGRGAAQRPPLARAEWTRDTGGAARTTAIRSDGTPAAERPCSTRVEERSASGATRRDDDANSASMAGVTERSAR